MGLPNDKYDITVNQLRLEEAENPTDTKSKRPDVFNHLAQIASAQKRKEVNADTKYAFLVIGMNNKNGKASFDLWLREQLPLPLSSLVLFTFMLFDTLIGFGFVVPGVTFIFFLSTTVKENTVSMSVSVSFC